MEMAVAVAVMAEVIRRHIIIKINQDRTGGTKTTKFFFFVIYMKMSCFI